MTAIPSPPLQIAIDGPAGAGKSTVAHRVAQALGYTYVDTGAMYRAVAWAVLQRQIDPDNAEAVTHLAERLDIHLAPSPDGTRVCADGQDITDAIRTPEISNLTSPLSALPGIRHRMAALQQALGTAGRVVMEGRDIGTVVLPHAQVKVFLTASLAARVARRRAELASRGISVSEEALAREIAERDARDSGRDVAPLVAAPDALVLDSDCLSVDEVVNLILEHCEEAARRDGS